MRTREIKENFRDVGMKIAIIGAGKMGAWFAKFFQGEGYTVIVSDKNLERLAKAKREFGVGTADAVSAIKGVDQILICVPIDSFEDVVKEIRSHIEPSQIVLDICSIKELKIKPSQLRAIDEIIRKSGIELAQSFHESTEKLLHLLQISHDGF